MLVLPGRGVGPVAVQQLAVVLGCVGGGGGRPYGPVVGVVGAQGCVLEGEFAGVEVGAQVLAGRLEYGARGELVRWVMAGGEIVRRGVGGERPARGGMVGRLLVELLLHGALLDVV